MNIQYVRLKHLVKAFYVGLSSLINSSIRQWSYTHCARASETNSGPESICIFSGYARCATILPSICTPCCVRIFIIVHKQLDAWPNNDRLTCTGLPPAGTTLRQTRCFTHSFHGFTLLFSRQNTRPRPTLSASYPA